MANNNDYDGLHVVQQSDRVDHSGNSLPIHASEAYKPQYQSQYPPQSPSQPQYHYTDKEPTSSTSSPPYYTTQAHPHGADPPPSNRQRNPWGLSPLAFAALVALLTAVIIGGAVGGGMGSAISSARLSCEASGSSITNPSATSAGVNTATGTSTSSSTSSTFGPVVRDYVPPAPSKVESLANDCASINGSTLTSAQGTRFRLTCPQAILGSGGAQGITLSETVAYTLIDCINACSLMNFWKDSTVCNSVTWDNGMAGATAANFGGNCWLFSDSGTVEAKANSTSARLVT